ncbi:MAG: hypothetical protein K2M70_13390 [Lachnospiraceae bacterium]|nr:hypothetical protein [Lachnospiraceae bacterium]
MRKKLLAGIMSVSLIFSVFKGGIIVNAETLPDNAENEIEFNEVSNEEMLVEETNDEANKCESNVMERDYTGESYAIEDGVATYSAEDDSATNTNPNYAYLVTNDMVVQGAVEIAGEMRWYAFALEEKSKISIILQMTESMDADLYMFSLNGSTYELELIGGSATAGVGKSEYFNSVMEAGTYFFAIGGYEGTGAFAFAYYQSTSDVSFEINDSQATAKNVRIENNTDVKGIIDCPYDVDYHQFTFTEAVVVKYSISSSLGYVLQYVDKSGDNAGIYKVNGNMVKIMPGTYCFRVYSPNGNYSASAAYTISFKLIARIADDSNAYCMAVSEDAGIVFQADANGQNCYVNGHKIDFNYLYSKSYATSGGSQQYLIQITPSDDLYVTMYESQFKNTPELQQVIPSVAMYVTSTFTKYSGPVLVLSLHSIERPIYSIHNVCTGAFSGNAMWKDVNYVNVFVDPNTGKVIDIEWLNYFYEIGSHSITYARPFTMKYYYPYINGHEPEGGDAK